MRNPFSNPVPKPIAAEPGSPEYWEDSARFWREMRVFWERQAKIYRYIMCLWLFAMFAIVMLVISVILDG